MKRLPLAGSEAPNDTASPKNRLGRILGGLVGKPVVAGETISVEPCIGKSFLIQVEEAPSGNGSTRVGVVMPNFA